MRSACVCFVAAVLATAFSPALKAQEQVARVDARDGLLFRVDTRFAFLAADADSFGNRPLFGLDVGLQPRRALPGSGPGLGFTLGATLGDGEFLAESKLSYRLVAGVELPWALSVRRLGTNPVELVPSFQVGYMKALKEDRRSGAVFRGALGLRMLPSQTSFYFTLEPLAIVYLPREAAGQGSRLAVELTVLKIGWRF